jgi:ketosteroid isomerase-like protein
MHKLLIAFAMTVLAAVPAAATDTTDLMSVIRQWVDGFNSGDTKSAVATCADQMSIIDDFPPHEWHGADACSKWFSDFQTMSKSDGITNPAITFGKPWHIESTADLAYVVAPTILSLERREKLVKDKGILTVTLRKGASGWRMTGWVWSDH